MAPTLKLVFIRQSETQSKERRVKDSLLCQMDELPGKLQERE